MKAQRSKGIAAGAGLSIGAVLGMGATAQANDYTVLNTSDGFPVVPAGSLREALNNTQAHPGLDRVLFAAGVSGTIHLGPSFTGLGVTEPTTIIGPGAGVLAISGDNIVRPFSSNQAVSGDPVKISGLTLTSGGAGSAGGGAIYSKNTYLTVDGLTISGNAAAATGNGGGINTINGTALIENSTISGNGGGNGGGLHASNTDVGIVNSTIAGNTATGVTAGYGYGGGIWLDEGASGSMIMYSDTVAGNIARYGGGITQAGSSNGIVNSVIANNTANSEIDLRNATADPFKLAFSLVKSTASTNIVDLSSFTGSNVFGVDPQLGPLQNNGGPTQTLRPARTSPLVDRGASAMLPVDQRGFHRPFDAPGVANPSLMLADAADIGAVELQSSDFPVAAPPSTTVRKKCKKKKHKKHASAAKKKKCKKKKKK
jgi:hypothetical protein